MHADVHECIITFLNKLMDNDIPNVNIFAPQQPEGLTTAEKMRFVTKEWFKVLLGMPWDVIKDVVVSLVDGSFFTKVKDATFRPIPEVPLRGKELNIYIDAYCTTIKAKVLYIHLPFPSII